MLDKLTRDDFARYLKQRFSVKLGTADSELKLELIEAQKMASATGEARRDPFSIVFRGPKEPMLAQGIYELVHSEMGALELFLVPIGQDDMSSCYEAVFT
jgi:hypothetical protein